MMAFHLKCYGSGIHTDKTRGEGNLNPGEGGSYRDSAGPGSGYKAAGTGSSGEGAEREKSNINKSHTLTKEDWILATAARMAWAAVNACHVHVGLFRDMRRRADGRTDRGTGGQGGGQGGTA
jgi:hypothetical protein